MEQQQARDRAMSTKRRAIIWTLWHEHGGEGVARPEEGETREEWFERFDSPIRMSSSNWRDNIVELAQDGYMDADLREGNHALLSFSLTQPGRQWAQNYFTKTVAGRAEHKQNKRNMKVPLEQRPGRKYPAQRRAYGTAAPMIVGPKSLNRLFDAARAVGVADGDDVVVYPTPQEVVYARIGDAAGWARRSVSVIVSSLERQGDPRVVVTRHNRSIQRIRFVGIGGGQPPYTTTDFPSVSGSIPQPPVEAAQTVRPDENTGPGAEAVQALLHAAADLAIAYNVVAQERDEAVALLEEATSPGIDPAVQEVIDAVARLNLSK